MWYTINFVLLGGTLFLKANIMSEDLTLNNTQNLVKHYCYLILNENIPNELNSIITRYLYIYKISYDEGHKILTRGPCCAGFWNGNRYRFGILAHELKSKKKMMIRLLDDNASSAGEFKIIQFPLSTNMINCDSKYKVTKFTLARLVGISECSSGYYSDNTEIKYKQYPTFLESYHNYVDNIIT